MIDIKMCVWGCSYIALFWAAAWQLFRPQKDSSFISNAQASASNLNAIIIAFLPSASIDLLQYRKVIPAGPAIAKVQIAISYVATLSSCAGAGAILATTCVQSCIYLRKLKSTAGGHDRAQHELAKDQHVLSHIFETFILSFAWLFVGLIAAVLPEWFTRPAAFDAPVYMSWVWPDTVDCPMNLARTCLCGLSIVVTITMMFLRRDRN